LLTVCRKCRTRAPVRQAEQVAEVFNGLFAELRAAFPAAIANFRTQAELTSSVVSGCWHFARTASPPWAGGRRYAHSSPAGKTVPAIAGQFIAWCRAEESAAIGLPDAAELVDMVYQYSRTRGQYPDAESYPGRITQPTGWSPRCTR
jgi:hypothetical protein